MIRTKMVVSDLSQHRGVRRDPETGAYLPHEVRKVTLHVCDGESPNNDPNVGAHPCGPLELEFIDPERAEFFEVGKAYMLEFSPAE